MTKNLYAGAVGLAIAVSYWVGADAIRQSPLSGGGVGAQAVPKLLGVALGGLSALLILQAVVARRRSRPRVMAATSATGRDSRHQRALGMLLIGAGYLLVVDVAGYVPALALLIALTAMYNGQRWSAVVAGVAVVGAAVYYVVFVQLLGIPLPPGPWPALWAAMTG